MREPDPGAAPRPDPAWAPYLVFGLALLVRVAYVLQIDASPLFHFPVVDARTYAEHAARLAEGEWLGRGEGPF